MGYGKKRGATDAAALIALLIELHTVMRAALKGFGLDYVHCFNLIPQSVVLGVTLETGHAPRQPQSVVRNLHTADPLL